MAENLIFAEQELAFASVEELGGAYAHDFESGNQFTMAVGQTYRIVWDGEPWDAVAWDASAYVDDTIGVGNAALLGLSGTNEPFLIAWSPNGTVIVSYDAEVSHRIAIYQVVEEETFLVVKKSSMKSVADSIRAKAGIEGDLEFPNGFKTAIEGITGSGGASDDVRYVTFMSEDGTEELGKIPVATGYDCPNPKFTATKKSTAQFHFTHDFWATQPNGATDRNALKAVTEDRVVYATFISVLRSYTITYYDSDGMTVLKTETLAYGVTPSYVPTSEDYDFDAWEPAVVPVTGNASYTATWKEKANFETSTWAEIKAICDAGNAESTFHIGDRKPVTFNYTDGTSETIYFRIIDMNADVKMDDTPIPLTLMAENLPKNSFIKPSSSKSNAAGSLTGCDKAKSYFDELFSASPAELQAVIAPVKRSAYTMWESGLFKFFTVTYQQLTGTMLACQDNPNDDYLPQKRYSYFANGGSIKRTKLNDDSADDYWVDERLAYVNYRGEITVRFAVVDGDSYLTGTDNAIHESTTATHGICPCFCI